MALTKFEICHRFKDGRETGNNVLRSRDTSRGMVLLADEKVVARKENGEIIVYDWEGHPQASDAQSLVESVLNVDKKEKDKLLTYNESEKEFSEV